jgi:hypothetical protein
MGKIITFVIVVFLLVGGYMIYDHLDTDFEESEDRDSFLREFAKWIFQLGKSTKSTVGHAIDQDWLPDVNESNVSIIEVD